MRLINFQLPETQWERALREVREHDEQEQQRLQAELARSDLELQQRYKDERRERQAEWERAEAGRRGAPLGAALLLPNRGEVFAERLAGMHHAHQTPLFREARRSARQNHRARRDDPIVIAPELLRGRRVVDASQDASSHAQAAAMALPQANSIVPPAVEGLQPEGDAAAWAEPPRSAAFAIQLRLIQFSTLQLSERLGAGAFGEVFRATWQSTPVAVKIIHALASREAIQEFEEESRRHAALRHLNIVLLYGICLERGRYAMVMELATQGSLFDLLHNRREQLPQAVCFSIARDIAAGLRYLHASHVLHRDLKSLNVLIFDGFRAKICDFGLSQVRTESSRLFSRAPQSLPGRAVGTLAWMAPELLMPPQEGECTRFSKQSDIYALAIVFWELMARKLPYAEAPNEAVLMGWILNHQYREPIPQDTPAPMAALIRHCWSQNRDNRPTNVDEVIERLDPLLN